jgi:DNA-binding CsgD family transcriptional regulator
MTGRSQAVQDQPALKTLLSVISDGVLATDLNGSRIYSNPTLDAYVGGDACAPRHSTAPPSFLPLESRDRYLQYVELMMRGSLSMDTIALDFAVMNAVGGVVEMPVRLVPVTSSRGAPSGMLWVFFLHDAGGMAQARSFERALEHIAEELRSVGFARTGGGQEIVGLDELSPRENEVFELLLVGHRVSTMADQLCLSKHTVRNHLKSIFKKTGVHSQAELVQLVRGDARPDVHARRTNGNGTSGNGHDK